jgi:phosphopantetheine--protein transferase-like protein
MILGIGTDIASIERFRNSRVELDKLASKILTDFEFDEYQNTKDHIKDAFIAKKWSAKEAISKAWGTGITARTTWKSMEIRHNQAGAPFVCFYGQLKNSADTLGARCHLTISDEQDTVIAYSIIEYDTKSSITQPDYMG